MESRSLMSSLSGHAHQRSPVDGAVSDPCLQLAARKYLSLRSGTETQVRETKNCLQLTYQAVIGKYLDVVNGRIQHLGYLPPDAPYSFIAVSL